MASLGHLLGPDLATLASHLGPILGVALETPKASQARVRKGPETPPSGLFVTICSAFGMLLVLLLSGSWRPLGGLLVPTWPPEEPFWTPK